MKIRRLENGDIGIYDGGDVIIPQTSIGLFKAAVENVANGNASEIEMDWAEGEMHEYDQKNNEKITTCKTVINGEEFSRRYWVCLLHHEVKRVRFMKDGELQFENYNGCSICRAEKHRRETGEKKC